MKCRNEAHENSPNRKDNRKTLQQQICRFFQARKKVTYELTSGMRLQTSLERGYNVNAIIK